jgi:hypothetical protein
MGPIFNVAANQSVVLPCAHHSILSPFSLPFLAPVQVLAITCRRPGQDASPGWRANLAVELSGLNRSRARTRGSVRRVSNITPACRIKCTAQCPTRLRAVDAVAREATSQSVSVLADEMMLAYEWIAILSCNRLASNVGDRPSPINMMSIFEVDESREDKSSDISLPGRCHPG